MFSIIISLVTVDGDVNTDRNPIQELHEFTALQTPQKKKWMSPAPPAGRPRPYPVRLSHTQSLDDRRGGGSGEK